MFIAPSTAAKIEPRLTITGVDDQGSGYVLPSVGKVTSENVVSNRCSLGKAFTLAKTISLFFVHTWVN